MTGIRFDADPVHGDAKEELHAGRRLAQRTAAEQIYKGAGFVGD